MRVWTHSELLLQARAAGGAGLQDAIDVGVELPGGDLRLLDENGLHQSIVDEDILLLPPGKPKRRSDRRGRSWSEWRKETPKNKDDAFNTF